MAELEDVTLDGKPLHSLRVADLKAALEQRGLAKSGQKNALIKRLKGALMLENLQRTSTPHAGLQPNSQIGEEMSQNSFIKQYLAKQQELLRQRMEREAREAAEAEDTNSPAGPDEDDHTATHDGTSYLPDKHHTVPTHPALSRAEEDKGGDRMEGMPRDPAATAARRLDMGSASVAQETPDVSIGRIWRPSFSQEEVATPSPPRAVASLSVRVVGQPERQGLPLIVPRTQEREGTAPAEAGPAHSTPQFSRSARAQEDSDEDDDEDDDDDSDEDDEWGPSSHGRKNVRPPPVQPPVAQRSRRKLQPPQHIPPQPQAAHQPPLQLRQPTPPPSPPPELSFPLPDTPKQSPPDQDEPAAPGEGAAPGMGGVSSPVSIQRQESSSSSRSSSPEPPAQRRPGPLSLLVRKMESEGAFGAGQKKEEDEEGDGAMEVAEQEDGIVTSGPGVLVFPRGANDGRGDADATSHIPSERRFEEAEQVAMVHPTTEIGPPELEAMEESEQKKEGRPQLGEEREPEQRSEEEKEEEAVNIGHSAPVVSWKRGREVSPPQASALVCRTSPTTSAPAVAKRPRIFSEVPPPECLMFSSKPEQGSTIVSGPCRADVTMETEETSVVPESSTERKSDEELKPRAETEKPASPQPAKSVEDAKKTPSVLPPSPPPEDGEAEKAREKAKRREKSSEPHSSPSSQSSSSSDSDSESSSSSSSGSSPQGKSTQKKDKKDKPKQAAPAEEQKEEASRDVKQAAVAEPTGPVAMELEERPESESALSQPVPQGAPEAGGSRPDESTTPKAFAARKISLTTAKPEVAAVEAESGGGAGRKRRWGSSTAVTAKKPSISITTESLKSLIPDMKPLQEAVVELHPDEGHFSGDEDAPEPAERHEDDDNQGLKIRRTVTQVVPSEGQENGQKEKDDDDEEEQQTEGEKEKEKPHRKQRRESLTEVAMETQEGDAKKVTPNDSVVRRSISQQKVGVSVTIDDPVRTARQLSPPRGKPSHIVHICNLVRPFTLGQLKELLNRTGAVVEEGFWIDKIKSHCYVTYSSTEEAVATREALHGVKWPSSNPKVLRVEFCEQDELDFHKALLTGDDPRVSAQAGRPAAPAPLLPPGRERELVAATPTPAPAPVRDQWAEREREMERRERTRLEREWDRDKVRDFGREERDTTRRSRSRDRDRRRKERGKSKERRSEKKDKPEEPPAKLLDDLFRKTKAAPCIYWLPLTEEQAAQRSQERAERMKEREKRRKELQEEEEKKREEERKERARGREKEGGNVGGSAGGSGRTGEGERDRERDREREREREKGREKEGEKRRESNKGRVSDSKPAGGSRRSRSRSNPSRDRRH